jgi:hypothetical protein
MAPIISIIRRAADILVTTPTTRNIPPITSKRPIRRASSGGRPMLPKKPWVLRRSFMEREIYMKTALFCQRAILSFPYSPNLLRTFLDSMH